MPTFPKTDDVNKAFKDGVDQARTPLLAALGAGDLAAQAVLDAVNKFRTQVNERTESAKAELPKDFSEFKAKLDPSEVRKQLETYGETAKKIYDQLSEHGEETFKKLQDSSQVKKVREQVGTAQGRVEDTVGDVRGLADDVLGRVTRTFAKDEAEAPKTQTAQAESTKAETAQAETATEKPAAEKPAPKPAAAKATPAAKAAAPKATPAAKKSTTTKTSGN
jgi:heparin binding hemagglutinin HbhA